MIEPCSLTLIRRLAGRLQALVSAHSASYYADDVRNFARLLENDPVGRDPALMGIGLSLLAKYSRRAMSAYYDCEIPDEIAFLIDLFEQIAETLAPANTQENNE